MKINKFNESLEKFMKMLKFPLASGNTRTHHVTWKNINIYIARERTNEKSTFHHTCAEQ